MATKKDNPDVVKTTKEPSAELEARREASKAQADLPGEPTTDKGPGKRLFQTGPDTREWLTEAEATAKGFFWKPDPDEPKGKKKA